LGYDDDCSDGRLLHHPWDPLRYGRGPHWGVTFARYSQRFVRPFLLILSAPVILVTLGFFILVLNGLLLLLVPNVVVGFHVDSFWSAFWGTIVISLVSWVLSAFFRGSDGRVHVLTHHNQTRRVQGRVLEDQERQ